MVTYCDKNFIKKISSTFTVCLPGYIGRSKIKSKKMIKNFKKNNFFCQKKQLKDLYLYVEVACYGNKIANRIKIDSVFGPLSLNRGGKFIGMIKLLGKLVQRKEYWKILVLLYF